MEDAVSVHLLRRKEVINRATAAGWGAWAMWRCRSRRDGEGADRVPGHAGFSGCSGGDFTSRGVCAKFGDDIILVDKLFSAAGQAAAEEEEGGGFRFFVSVSPTGHFANSGKGTFRAAARVTFGPDEIFLSFASEWGYFLSWRKKVTKERTFKKRGISISPFLKKNLFPLKRPKGRGCDPPFGNPTRWFLRLSIAPFAAERQRWVAAFGRHLKDASCCRTP